MAKIPYALGEERLLPLLQPGEVFIYYDYPCITGPRDKFLIIGIAPVSGHVQCFMTTTVGDFYARCPQYERQIVRVSPGTFSFFDEPTDDTIIQCDALYRLTINGLVNQYCDSEKFEHVGRLTSIVAQNIISILPNCGKINVAKRNIVIANLNTV
jgi:hypothetical protein